MKKIFNKELRNVSAILESTRSKHDDKLSYACKKVLDRLKEPANKFNSALEDIDLEHASVDKEGNLVYLDGDKGFKYTKEAMKKRKADIVKLLDEAIEVEPYYCTQLPERYAELSIQFKEILEGLVVEPKIEVEDPESIIP
jgi:hypothetical protein